MAANGSAVQFYYVEEVAGEIPVDPVFLPIRFNTASLSRNTAQVDSAEINQNRQRPVAKQGTYSTAGDIACELSSVSFDDLLAIAMQSEWATNTLKIGSDVRSIAILKRHTDISEDYIYRGCRINTVALSGEIDSRVGITFGVIGTSIAPYVVPVGATFGAASATEPMVTSVGSLLEGGLTPNGCITSFNATLDNGMAPLFGLFERAACTVQNGVATVSGTLSVFREAGGMYAKFLNETETSIKVTFSDGTATRSFEFPKAIYTGVDDPVSGPDAIVNAFNFSAGYSALAGTTLTVTRSP